jgi:demethylmenaquinone methyltransferase/2-methoxy-6-polyprenyl-1,4-benzoquinol methylase
MPPIARYDGLADWYDAFVHGEGREWTARVEVLLRPLLGTGRGRCLDLGCGTGAFLPLIAELGWSPVGVDVSADQLRVARASAGDLVEDLVQADAAALPFADGSFDAATVGFGIRNVADLERGLTELRRVLRPGGRLAILEITQPRGPLRPFFSLWFDRVVPTLGRILPGGSAYVYLPASVRRFPDAESLAQSLARRGFADVTFRLMGGSIVALHVGRAA